MIQGSDHNESRRRSFGGGFFMLRNRLLFDVCAGIAEPFRCLSSKATDYMHCPWVLTATASVVLGEIS